MGSVQAISMGGANSKAHPCPQLASADPMDYRRPWPFRLPPPLSPRFRPITIAEALTAATRESPDTILLDLRRR
jgi:hypothetical protein